MPGQRTREQWVSRELVVSSDLVRIGQLSAMEAQNADALKSIRNDGYNPETNTFDDLSAAAKAANSGDPMFGLNLAPSLDGIVGSFDMTIGTGEGYVVGSGTIPGDESAYQICRWDGQRIAWPADGVPDPSHRRICTIYATPGDGAADPQSRNILVNPSTREVAPVTSYKTSKPVATIAVVVGSPSSAPVPPTVPDGSLPLFDVSVEAGATDSTGFVAVRRAWRRIEFPGSAMHGIVDGCVPDLTSVMTPHLKLSAHRLVIDGEMLAFATAISVFFSTDTANNPGAAPAGNDLPTYLYLCGGRHQPVTVMGIPVAIIESATPPDQFGYPTADLGMAGNLYFHAVTFPRAACCFIGVKFRGAGSSNGVPCYYSGDWIYPTRLSSFVQPVVSTDSSSGYQAVTMPTIPACSTDMLLRLFFTGTASPYVSVATATSDTDIVLLAVKYGGATVGVSTITGHCLALGTLYHKGLTSPDSIYIKAAGFNMNVPRLK